MRAREGLRIGGARPATRSTRARLTGLAVFVAALALAAPPALAAFPYSRPGTPDLTDFSDLYLDAGQTPNDLDGDDNRFKYAATPDPANAINNGRPTELAGVRGNHVVDQSTGADTAWMTTTGRPDVTIATLDSGIEWNNEGAMNDLRFKTRLNQGELPLPLHDRVTPLVAANCGSYLDEYDANDDGVFNIRDYACDSRVDTSDPRRDGPSGYFTPQDVLIAFTDSSDADGNGYVDDVVGWDFLDDDNDPYDDVQYGHGTGEAQGSSSEADNGNNAGSCPNCMVIHMRVGDSFIADVNRFAEAVIYATDNDVQVIQEALGTLNNSSHARDAVDYAYEHGVTTIASAADEAAQHNNWPSSLPHVILVNSVTQSPIPPPDQSYLAFNGCTNFNAKITLAIESTSCSSDAVGVGSGLAGLVYSAAYNAFDDGKLTPNPGCTLTGDGPDPGSGGPDDCVITANEVRQVMATGTIDGDPQPDDVDFAGPPGSVPGPTGEPFCLPPPLAQPGCTDPNGALQTQVNVNRPVLLPATRSYPARFGPDQFYGYGRAQMEEATEALDPDATPDPALVPPEVEISSPEWYQQVDPATTTLEIQGQVFARGQSYSCRVYVAPGHYPNNSEAPDGDFHEVTPASGPCDGSARTAELDGTLAALPVATLRSYFPPDATAPPANDFTGREPGAGIQTSNGRPNTDPYGFTLKVVATSGPGGTTLTGEDRRSAFLHRDQDMLDDFPQAINHSHAQGGRVQPAPATPTGDGESSPAFADLDGDNRNEMIFGTSDGFVHALERDPASGAVSELAGWPVRGDVPGFVSSHTGTDAYGSGEVSDNVGGAIVASVAVGDTNRDGAPEVYAADLEGKLYGWSADGQRVFTEESEPDFSGRPLTPFVEERIGPTNRTQHGFLGSPVLADLDGDGRQEIVAAAMDRHLYAWSASDSTPGAPGGAAQMPGFPVLVVDASKVDSIDPDSEQVRFRADSGSEQQGAIIVTPAVGDLDGDADATGPDELPEIVIGTNEEYRADAEPAAPNQCGTGCAAGWNGGISNAASLNLLDQIGGFLDDFLAECDQNFGGNCPDNPLPLEPGNSRLYAIYPDGDQHPGDSDAFLSGWPARPAIVVTGLLPVVGEGITGSPVIGPVSCSPGGAGPGPKVGTLANNGPAYVLGPDGGSCYGKDAQGKDVTLQTDVTPAPTYDHPLLPAVGHPAFGNLEGESSPSFLAPAAGINRALDLGLPEYQVAGQDFISAWSTQGAGQLRPGWPAPVNDLQFLTGPSIGEVDGLPGEDVVEGTASKDLAGLSSFGAPLDATWPKVTTDWTVANPLIGTWGTLDTDPGTGKVVVNLTRSGYVNAYQVAAGACSPSSWPRFHHDNANSGHYLRDAVLPGRPKDQQLSSGSITLTAPGDELMCGPVDHYELVTSDQPIDESNWSSSDPLPDQDADAAPGSTETLTVAAEARRYVGIRAVDEQGNVGRPVSLEVGGGGPGPGPDPGPAPEPPAGEPPAGDQPPGPGGPGGPCANVIAGSPGADKLTGTEGADRINGRGGRDKIKGGSGDDCLRGGPGRDKIKGGEGDDKIHVRGGRTDKVNCGPGEDTVVASRRDTVRKSCEKVRQ